MAAHLKNELTEHEHEMAQFTVLHGTDCVKIEFNFTSVFIHMHMISVTDFYDFLVSHPNFFKVQITILVHVFNKGENHVLRGSSNADI